MSFYVHFCPLSVCLSVMFSYFHLLLKPLDQVRSNKGHHPFPRGDNYEISNSKTFSNTTQLISTKLDTKLIWVEGIQVYSNEELHSFQRDNCKNMKITLTTLKLFIFRTTGSISTKLGTNHVWKVMIQVCSNEGSHPFLEVDVI